MLSTSLKPSTENSLRVRLGDRTGGFFGNLGDLDISWDVWASLGDFLDSILILGNNKKTKQKNTRQLNVFLYLLSSQKLLICLVYIICLVKFFMNVLNCVL